MRANGWALLLLDGVIEVQKSFYFVGDALHGRVRERKTKIRDPAPRDEWTFLAHE